MAKKLQETKEIVKKEDKKVQFSKYAFSEFIDNYDSFLSSDIFELVLLEANKENKSKYREDFLKEIIDILKDDTKSKEKPSRMKLEDFAVILKNTNFVNCLNKSFEKFDFVGNGVFHEKIYELFFDKNVSMLSLNSFVTELLQKIGSPIKSDKDDGKKSKSINITKKDDLTGTFVFQKNFDEFLSREREQFNDFFIKILSKRGLYNEDYYLSILGKIENYNISRYDLGKEDEIDFVELWKNDKKFGDLFQNAFQSIKFKVNGKNYGNFVKYFFDLKGQVTINYFTNYMLRLSHKTRIKTLIAEVGSFNGLFNVKDESIKLFLNLGSYAILEKQEEYYLFDKDILEFIDVDISSNKASKGTELKIDGKIIVIDKDGKILEGEKDLVSYLETIESGESSKSYVSEIEQSDKVTDEEKSVDNSGNLEIETESGEKDEFSGEDLWADEKTDTDNVDDDKLLMDDFVGEQQDTELDTSFDEVGEEISSGNVILNLAGRSLTFIIDKTEDGDLFFQLKDNGSGVKFHERDFLEVAGEKYAVINVFDQKLCVNLIDKKLEGTVVNGPSDENIVEIQNVLKNGDMESFEISLDTGRL